MSEPTVHWPPFPPLARDEYFWSGDDVLPAWSGFQSRRGPYTSIDQDEPSDGTVRVTVTPKTEGARAPTAGQLAAYAFLKAEQDAIAHAILDRLLTIYPAEKLAYEEAVDDTWPELPEVSEPEQFRSLIGLGCVHVLTVERDGMAYVGFEFGCDWEDHGLGVLTHGSRVVEVGHAEVAFNDWVPDGER